MSALQGTSFQHKRLVQALKAGAYLHVSPGFEVKSMGTLFLRGGWADMNEI